MTVECATVVPVATVQADGSGLMQQIRIAAEPHSELSVVLDEDMDADGTYRDQLVRVTACARQLLDTTVLADVCCDSRRAARVRISLTPRVREEGGSHGLATLVSVLQYLLDAPIRADRVFAASLGAPAFDSGEILLEYVSDVAAKARVAGRGDNTRLFYHWREEAGEAEEALIRRHTIAHHKAEGDARCLPVPLRRSVCWTNLVNLAIDTEALLERSLATPGKNNRAVLVLACNLLTSALRSPAAEGEYPVGVGPAIAKMRSLDICPDDLPEQLGFDDLVGLCPEAHLDDLMKIALPGSPESSIRDDYRQWIQAEKAHQGHGSTRMPLHRAITALDVAQVHGWLDEEQESFLTQWICSRMNNLPGEVSDAADAADFLGRTIRSLLAVGAAHESILAGAIKAIERLSMQVPDEQRASLQGARQALARKIIAPALASKRNEPTLTLTFAVRPSDEGHDRCEKCGSWPTVPLMNALQLAYRTSTGLEATLPSPVLLVEHSRALRTYCQRSEFRDADDTSARIPAAGSTAISQLFNRTPNRIEFQLHRTPHDEGVNVGVLWVPEQVPFPPAIDSQFFVAALQRWCHEAPAEASSLSSVIDVGCGTGYLTAAAAHLLPAVEQLMLVDLDERTVTMAADNLDAAVRTPCHESGTSRFDRVAPAAQISTWAGDFTRYPRNQRFDLMLCNPPYLPELQLVGSGIERATNGTHLLREVVSRALEQARYTLIVFSALAWREVEYAIARQPKAFRRITVYDRQLVPLRIRTIEPILPEENRDVRDRKAAERQFVTRLDYYSTLMRPGRDLIDLDDERWDETLNLRVARSRVELFRGTRDATPIEDRSGMTEERYRGLLESLSGDSRGFRFWHETRVVLLEADQ